MCVTFSQPRHTHVSERDLLQGFILKCECGGKTDTLVGEEKNGGEEGEGGDGRCSL